MRARLVLPLLLAASLVGCASLSQTECAGGDWDQIGYRDGSSGYGEGRIEAHRKACAEYGIGVDGDTWRAGYERGIERYCTPANAVHVALAGESYNGVCPGPNGRVFEQYYGAGRVVYEQRQRVVALEQQRRALKEQIDKADTEEKRDALRYELRRLDRSLDLETERLRWSESRLFLY